MTGFDIQTAMRFDLPYIAIVGNNRYMNQIRIGQIQEVRPGDAGTSGITSARSTSRSLPICSGIHGEVVREAKEIKPALERARASGTCAIVNVWLDADESAPGTETRRCTNNDDR